jgi:hypothetical protein
VETQNSIIGQNSIDQIVVSLQVKIKANGRETFPKRHQEYQTLTVK